MSACRLTAIAVATAGLLAAPSGPAAAVEGLYTSLMAGASFHVEQDAEIAGTTRSIDYEPGPAVAGALGYGFGNGFRAEVEVSWRGNEQEDIGDRFRAIAGMANAYYDIDFNLDRVHPYLGLGLGIAGVSANDIAFDTTGTVIDDGDPRFAFQGIAGLAVDLTDHIDFLVDYRFFGTPGSELDAVDATGTRQDADTDYFSHSVLAGFRYRFEAPDQPPVARPADAAPPAPTPVADPPPPPPPPAPTEPRTFMVFFDFNRSDLTEDGRIVVATAANTALRFGYTRLVVSGHADRSGSARYNEALSQRRAETVRNLLTTRGVPGTAISIRALGEAEPLLPTADGVREPQNRRVEIVLDQ